MSKSTVSLAAEGETLKEAYAALNWNDISEMAKAFDPEIEWVESDISSGGTYRGHEVVKAHLTKARDSWAKGSCEPERYIAAGDKIVVFVHVRVRLKHEVEWREGRLADVYTFRHGKAVQMRVFADRREALEWAGVEQSLQTHPLPIPEHGARS